MRRYYPEQTGDWLCQRLQHRHRALLHKKVLTHLPPDIQQAALRSAEA
jgi:hypothetical protein